MTMYFDDIHAVIRNWLHNAFAKQDEARESRDTMNARVLNRDLDTIIQDYRVEVDLNAVLEAARQKNDIGNARYHSLGGMENVVLNLAERGYGTKIMYVREEGKPINTGTIQISISKDLGEDVRDFSPQSRKVIKDNLQLVVQSPNGGKKTYRFGMVGAALNPNEIVTGDYTLTLEKTRYH